jgi:hypothetical protein
MININVLKIGRKLPMEEKKTIVICSLVTISQRIQLFLLSCKRHITIQDINRTN